MQGGISAGGHWSTRRLSDMADAPAPSIAGSRSRSPDAPEAERPDGQLVLHGGEDGEAPAADPFREWLRRANARANANDSATSSVTTDDSFDAVLEADPRTPEGIGVIFGWSETSRYVRRLPPHFPAPV